MLGIGRGDGRFGRRGGVHVGHIGHRTRSEIGSLVRAMERFGFVGLPNAGKSSLYNALAGGGAHAAPYAFATTDPNVGVAKVPDHRLDALSEMSQSKQTIHAAVQFTDIGGLVEGRVRVKDSATPSSATFARSMRSCSSFGRLATTTSRAAGSPRTPACGRDRTGARRSRECRKLGTRPSACSRATPR